MPNIPEELIEEILCRVPAISLKRLRSTCKEWKRLFNDTKFSRKHFDKAPKQYPVVVITKERMLCSMRVNLHDGKPSAKVTGEFSLNHVRIDKVFHCDGLLLCTILGNSRSIIVWNPCTGQIKLIKIAESQFCRGFVLGYYQDKKFCNKSYKILSYKSNNSGDQEIDIYDVNSNSWRNLNVTPPIPDFLCSQSRVSLKGKTYWLDRSEAGLISFDYTTEIFERLLLPYQYNIFEKYYLSVVGEEKLSVLLQHTKSSRSEVWITNKIDDETKEMSWSRLLAVEDGIGRTIWSDRSFLVDEEKKIVVCCERVDGKPNDVITVSIVGAYSNTTRGPFPVKTMPLHCPFMIDYVPSLIQIQ